ncbi:hypothetical protein CSUI_005905, partial [Cystoisospora suis]
FEGTREDVLLFPVTRLSSRLARGAEGSRVHRVVEEYPGWPCLKARQGMRDRTQQGLAVWCIVSRVHP